MLGLYDSGLGGLTILNELQKLLPNIEICYLADTKNCPLGEKTNQEILEITKNGVEFLFKNGCNLVVLACNTATVIAIRELQNNWLPLYYPDKKILGIVRPVPELLVEKMLQTNINLLLLATPATVNSGFYKQELKDFNYQNVTEFSCPGLAVAIESQNSDLIAQTIAEVFKNNPNNYAKFDIILLACTHYPLATNIIKTIFIENGGSPEVKIFDQTKLIAGKLLEYLKNHPEVTLNNGKTKIIVTKNKLDFESKIALIFPKLVVESMLQI